MSRETVVSEKKECDFCNDGETAKYDGKTVLGGRWAYMCKAHFEKYGVGLGTGKGQKLIHRDQKGDTQANRMY